MENEYPRTLDAVERAEISLWPVVEALVAEVAMSTTTARRGEYERVAEYLSTKGYRTWSEKRLSNLHQIGRWANGAPGARFTQFPVERVIEARKAAKSDHAKALELLGTATSKRDFRADTLTTKLVKSTSEAKIEEVVDDLPDEKIEEIAKAVEKTKAKRKLYPDKPKPSHEKATKDAKKKDTETLKNRPDEVAARLGSLLGDGRATTRAICQTYQDSMALVQDGEWREYLRERLIGYRADVDLALGEVLNGSLEDALARLTAEMQEG